MTIIEHQLKLIPTFDIMDQIETTSEGFIGKFQQYILKSVFQPVFSFSHDSPIGYEALLRATDNNQQEISPIDLFSSVYLDDELLQLELISRTLHILNFFQEETSDALLFLNINPKLINDNKNCLKQLFILLNEYNIPPTRIVIEFIEESFTDIDILIKATKYLRQNGCLIAIDDFGAGHSNFNRVWDLRPDIVKLDKALINRVRSNSWFHRPVKNLVELLHESESLVLIEGVEDEVDADIAHELDVDFHQGYFFGRPKLPPFTHNQQNHYLKNSNAIFQRNINKPKHNIFSEKLQHLFIQAVMGTQAEINMDRSCEGLLNHPYVILCYMLDDKGYQVGHPVHGKHSMQNLNYRYGKLNKTNGVNWSRRTYFLNALSEPMVTQITRPYLSLTSARMCITLSIAVKIKDEFYVLCCDLRLP